MGRIQPAQLLLKATVAAIVEAVGTGQRLMFVMVNTKKFSREYGHGRANYINGPLVAGASSLPAKN